MPVSWAEGGLDLDALDRALLNAVQSQFPVVTRPYLELARITGSGEEEAYEHMQNLRREGVIRRLGAVFDSHRLGYCSTLCAAKVPPDKVSLLADMLAGIAGVTHNYLREHIYNMWFTLIAPSQAAVEDTLVQLRRQSGIADIYSLPATRLFKIKVDFDFNDETDDPECATDVGKTVARPGVGGSGRKAAYALTGQDIALVRILQGDLPHDLTPFATIAANLGWAETEVLARTGQLQAAGVIRRFGAVLRHQKAGFTANAMGVWQVPLERVEEVGAQMSAFREVSHCYQRPTLADWPYNLFTMVHGRSPADCRHTMQAISKATGIDDYDMLFSVAELKKSSMQYFPEGGSLIGHT